MNPCTQKWLKEALRLAKPAFFELWFPAYSAHYNHLNSILEIPIKYRNLALNFCEPDNILSFIHDIEEIHSLMLEEINDMEVEELERWAFNPKMHELERLLYGLKTTSKEEEEEFWGKYDDEEEDPDPWEEEKNEDWVEDWEEEEDP
jgi:hypothetical protein